MYLYWNSWVERASNGIAPTEEGCVMGIIRKPLSVAASAITAAAVLALGPLPAAGADEEITLPGASPPIAKIRDSRFTFLDIDADGYISRDEIPEDDLVLRSQFPALDRNHDGRLDLDEYVVSRR
jgi:hypothetical protein